MRTTTIDNENHLRGKQSANPPLGMVCASWRDRYHTPMKFSGMSEPDCETSVERGVLSQANSRNEAIIEFLHQHPFIRRGLPLRPRVVACSLRIPKRGVLQLTGAFFSVPAPYPNFQTGHVRQPLRGKTLPFCICSGVTLLQRCVFTVQRSGFPPTKTMAFPASKFASSS